ncbi:MAG: DNA gyrase C-terminal beta-propeller domain-containing protein, partial [Verrucomicrobiales bacterium]
IALANLDDFIRIIRDSANREEAKQKLMAYAFDQQTVEQFGILIRSQARLEEGRYVFSEAQVNAILELRLYQLTGMETDKVKKEYGELLETIKDLMDILAREIRVLTIIKEELQRIREKYATPRRSELIPFHGNMLIEDLIANEPVIITLSHNGLIKRTQLNEYRSQRRGGKGVIGMGMRSKAVVDGKDKDFVEHLFSASTHDSLMIFTNTGRVYVERVHELPELSRTSQGRNIANVLELQPDEKVAALIRVESVMNENKKDITWEQPGFLIFATQNGTVKKTELAAFKNYRKGGIKAINILEEDRLIEVKRTSGEDDVVLITHQGKSIRFNESNARSMGRATSGVRGINLVDTDRVVALSIVEEGATLLVASENGIGKRTTFEEYRQQSRGGKGIITMRTGEKTGGIIGALSVHEHDEIMLITVGGQMIRIAVDGIREAGRNTMGVKLVDTKGKDKLQAIAPVINEDQEEEGEEDAGSGEDAPDTE